MEIDIMVLEDNPAIRGAYEILLKDRFEGLGFSNVVINSFATTQEAILHTAEISKDQSRWPRMFDLVLTDINLNGFGVHATNDPNKDGAEFAKFVKKTFPTTPIIGVSGMFAEYDLAPEDNAIFDKYWTKKGSFTETAEIINSAVDFAINHATQREAHHLEQLTTPVTDEDYQAAGYSQAVIIPNASNALANPFEIWKKISHEGAELEVVGCKPLFSWADTYVEAEENLIELIRFNAADFVRLDTLSPDKAHTASFANELVRTVGMKL